MKVAVEGNPGQGNSFQETNVGHAESVNPNAKTVIQTIYNGPRNDKVRPTIITAIINRLSDPTLVPPQNEALDTRLYEIQPKIQFNSLTRWDTIIHDYAFWSADVDKIYREFDAQGKSKSCAVLNWLNRQYMELRDAYEGDILFDRLRDRVYEVVNNDPTCNNEISMEELDENVCIVLVDAFMKCRIFEKPI